MLKLPYNCAHFTCYYIYAQNSLSKALAAHELELPDIQVGFRKARGTRDQIANIPQIIEKSREFQKSIYFCFIAYAKAFDCVDYIKLWKILKGMGVPDDLPCLLRNLYMGQEAIVRTRRGTDRFKIGKGVQQGYCHHVYLTSMQSTSCEMQAGWITTGTKIAGRNINNLRYADDTTLMAESEEEL